MTIRTDKAFIFSFTVLGTLALFETASVARQFYYADEYFTEDYKRSLIRTVQSTNALEASPGDRLKGKKTPPKKSNTFGSAMDFHAGAPQLRDLVRKTDTIVDGYQSKIPQLNAKKGQLGKATVRTRTAFSNLVDDTVALIENEGRKVRQLPYNKSGGSYTEDLTAYQMQVNCSIQGVQTVQDMLSSGQDNIVCRKVLANYYPKEADPQSAPSKFQRMMNWLASWGW